MQFSFDIPETIIGVCVTSQPCATAMQVTVSSSGPDRATSRHVLICPLTLTIERNQAPLSIISHHTLPSSHPSFLTPFLSLTLAHHILSRTHHLSAPCPSDLKMTTIPIAPSHLHLLKIPAQILAITTSALFAGYTASLSLITVPMLLAHFGTPSSSSSATSKPPRSVSTTQTPTTPVADDHTSTGSAGVDTMDESVINDAAGMGSGDSKLKSPLSEALLLSQWRQMYVHGARTSRPATIIPVICYIFLIYTTIEEMTMKAQAGDTHYNERGAGGGRQLGGVLMWYCVALVGQCGIVVALTTLRRTNGALGRRCEVGSRPLSVF